MKHRREFCKRLTTEILNKTNWNSHCFVESNFKFIVSSPSKHVQTVGKESHLETIDIITVFCGFLLGAGKLEASDFREIDNRRRRQHVE